MFSLDILSHRMSANVITTVPHYPITPSSRRSVRIPKELGLTHGYAVKQDPEGDSA